MDLTQLSPADQQAIANNDYSALSDEGLDFLLNMPEQESGPPDIAGKADEAVEKYTESLSGGQRFLIGAGKSLNDVITGVQQFFSDDEAAGEIAKRVERERKLYDTLDKQQVGLEDLGEFAGDASLYALGGGAGATIKGGALLGALIEGSKATAEDESRLGNAAVGAALGGVGGKIAKRGVDAAAAKRAAALGIDDATQILHENAMKDMVAGGLAGMAVPGAKRAGMWYLVKGAANFLKVGHQAKVLSQSRGMSAAGTKVLVDAKRRALATQRDEAVANLGTEMLERFTGVVNSMTPKGRGAVLNETTKQTLSDIVKTSTTKMPNGMPGVDYATLVQNMPFESAIKSKLSKVYRDQLSSLMAEFKSRAGEIAQPAQIEAEVAKYAELVISTGLDLNKVPVSVKKAIFDQVKDAGRRAVAGGAALQVDEGIANNLNMDALRGLLEQRNVQQ